LGGLLHGPLKSHRASDQTLELESNYFNGQLHGPYRLYDAQGGIVESGLYEQGIIRFSEKLKAE
jgi:antitoxin component YwqK of YwqJK toxin-antitoxin module